MKQYISNRGKRSMAVLMKVLGAALFVLHSSFYVSCSDFFEQESDNVIYASQEHLVNWPDTVSSMMGILAQLQQVADRTVLLGEVRGDLVSLTPNASADLRELATFTADDDNVYNQPRDYYAVINNCNYYIAHADTALKSNRNEYIFMKEFAAVKAIRAWTYLQLVLNYGSVPFITEPILTKEESEATYPRYELAQVCQFFIDDLATLPERYDTELPSYGNYNFFPLNIVRGDLYLWLGSALGREAGRPYFEQAALCYYKYIANRNTNSYYATGLHYTRWSAGSTSWNRPSDNYSSSITSTSTDAQAELITMIQSNANSAQGFYSVLPDLFCSTTDNDYKYSITPSERIVEISEAQANAVLAENGMTATYAPAGLSDHRSGDLRLWAEWNEGYVIDYDLNSRIETQYIGKYVSITGARMSTFRDVRIYRRSMVYLRLAEALNLAGYPRVAYKILERGVTNVVLQQEVLPYLSQADSAWVAGNLNFPSDYRVVEAEYWAGRSIGTTAPNTMGIHSYGSGYTPYNEYYRLLAEDSVCVKMLPDSTFVFDDEAYASLKQLQQQQVDSLLLDEDALELCFEGTRFYDLMRFALRSDNPGQFLSSRVNRRQGGSSDAGLLLTDPHSWYLRWKGQIGY